MNASAVNDRASASKQKKKNTTHTYMTYVMETVGVICVDAGKRTLANTGGC